MVSKFQLAIYIHQVDEDTKNMRIIMPDTRTQSLVTRGFRDISEAVIRVVDYF